MSGYIGAIPVPQATQTRQSFTATAGQTTFATAGYTPNFVDVYMNGVHLLDGTDYTANNGTSIVLASGAAAGDELNIVAFKSFTTADMVPASTGGTFSGDVTFAGAFTSQGIDDNATSTAMTLDSNGNLLVGKTTTGSGTDGFEARSNGFIATSRDDDIVATINRNTSNGDIVQFRKDNTTVGSIGATSATHLHVGSGDTGLLFQGSANAVEPWNISTNGPRDDTIDLGLTSNRFRKAYLGQNVFVRTTSLGGFVASAAIQSNGGTGHGAAFQTDATSGFAAACFSRNSNNGAVQEFFYNVSSSAVGTITITSSATSYNTSSDHRLKENVETLSGAISRVKQLQPKRFSWIVDNEDSATVDGFLAHEAQTVVPEAVTGAHNEVDADGNPVYQGIDQSKLVPLLTAALQEAIDKIETLETKVAALEANT